MLKWLTISILPFAVILGQNIPLIGLGGRFLRVGFTEIVLVVILLGLLVKTMVSGHAKFKVDRSVLLIGLLFNLTLLFSAINFLCIQKYFNLAATVVAIILAFEYFTIFILTYHMVTRTEDLKSILKGLNLFAIANLGAIIYQTLTFNFNDSRTYGLFVSSGGAANSNPNIVGLFTAGCSMFYLAYFYETKGIKRFGIGVLAALSVAATFFTLSRSALLGLVLGGAYFCYVTRRWYLPIVGIIIAIPVVLKTQMLLTRLIETFFLKQGSVSSGGITTRFELWTISITNSISHPFGHGIGSAYIIDNQFFQLLFDAGIFAPVLLIILLVIIWKKAKLRQRIATAGEWRPFLIAYQASFFVLLAGMMASSVFQSARILGLFWILTAVMLKGLWIKKNSSES